MQGLDQLAKGAKRAIHELAILQEEVAALCTANHELSQRRCTKKRRLQDRGSLTVQEAQDLRTIKSGGTQLQMVLPGNSNRTNLSPALRRCCGLCGEYGHNVRTCQNKEEIPEDSESE